ncbi:MAG: hypothetical protein E4G94_07960, partial [ANME-2 cluster archaeon]
MVEHITKTNTAGTEGIWEGYWISAGDDASYIGVISSISIDKQVSGHDGLWYNDSAINYIGDPVWYNFIVKNTGEVNLTNIQVVDDILGPVLLPQSYLEPGEEMTTLNISNTAVEGTHYNTANTTAEYLGVTRFDTDTASYIGRNPITVEKKVSLNESGPWNETVSAYCGEDFVYFKVIIENTGLYTLTNLTAIDWINGSPSNLTLSKSMLDPGESMSLTYSTLVDDGQNVNIVEASGRYSDKVYNDSDSAEYLGLLPENLLNVDKKVSMNETGPWFETIDALSGEDIVYYKITVTNVGGYSVN